MPSDTSEQHLIDKQRKTIDAFRRFAAKVKGAVECLTDDLDRLAER